MFICLVQTYEKTILQAALQPAPFTQGSRISQEITYMNEERAYDLAELFKAFSDSTRVKILLALFEGELNVSQLVEEIGATQTAVSHQLRSLKASHLVRCRRDGKNMFYSLADDHVKIIMDCAIEHIEE